MWSCPPGPAPDSTQDCEPHSAARRHQQRPDWLPEGVSVVEHVQEASRRSGRPPELDDPDADWGWDAGDLVAEAWRLGCIPEADMQRALWARGEDKPYWWKELKAASGDSLYIRDDPAITMAAASGALGERALSVYNDLAAKGLINKTTPSRQPARPRTAPSTAPPPPETGGDRPQATWRKVGDKTIEVTLTTTSARRYRADDEALDKILAAAVATGRLSDPQRMATPPATAAGVSVATGPNGHRQATKTDGTATATAERIGAKTAEVTLTATSTRRYRGDDTEALRICATAETLGGLFDRAKMLPDHTRQRTGPAQPQDHSPADGGLQLGM